MSGLKPEERAREWIDRKLEDAGWQVINRDEYWFISEVRGTRP